MNIKLNDSVDGQHLFVQLFHGDKEFAQFIDVDDTARVAVEKMIELISYAERHLSTDDNNNKI